MTTAIKTIAPPLARIRVSYDASRIDDVAAATHTEIAASGVSFAAGERIAICCGSRGIANIAEIVRAVVSDCRAAGAEPFIVPAMGSHGGATASGQAEVLASYGIDEASVDAPVHSSMETVELPSETVPHRLHMDRCASEADGIVLINRVKPHTDFRAPIESGLLKMAVIGLGKRDQAEIMHSYGVPGLRDMIVPAARELLRTGRIRLGIGIVENALDETMEIRAMAAETMEQQEMELLEHARAAMPALPLDDVDVLVIDEMGKDISGCGIDTNIIGRIRIAGEPEPERPRVRRIVCTDLTSASHGNATGFGLADIITRRLYDKVDFDATYANIITSTFLERGMTPLTLPTDAEAVECALRTCSVRDPSEARVIRIRNTLQLSEMWVSPAAWDAIEQQGMPATRIGDFVDPFTDDGELLAFGGG